ncbi:AarF/ABC1/UbiB kinase family protein [Pseudoclavibacter chungangensis]|uniref:AarF/ABC1/UbiB kinase family protein n=2 Tax=Pseudoclavibacter chungangensis TaxID=587635 RepID=A0A7J5BLY5_9MICO|nr:AarF/ABC1/UbiB kinase family protein [Pseudoclavibacter chungangensis]
MRFAARHLAITWWFELFLPRIGLTVLGDRTRARRMQQFARRFNVLAIELGGLMIKVGQFMSSRLDVVPPEITRELEGLQDEVPAVPFDRIRSLAEAELGLPLDRVFAEIDEHPLAAASLGQVHRARLGPDDAAIVGTDRVVIKVQRPDIGTIVEVDLTALRKVGRWLSRVRIVADRVDMPVLVEEFARTSLEEIDYLHEAVGSERFADDFADDSRVTVPAVVWERTTRRVLTLEDVSAIKITDLDGLRAAGIDPAEVAPVFASLMFEQLFGQGYFHADPHPGNIFVTPHPPDAVDSDGPPWTITFVDFGMMGEISTRMRRGLRRLVIAAAARDGAGLVAAVKDVGVLLPSADTAELQRAMTKLFERFGGMGFAELREVDPNEFRSFADEFGDVVRSMPFQLPENFLLVVRALSITSGVCSSLDARFNLWDSVEPFAARMLREEQGGAIRDLTTRAGDAVASLARLPGRIDTLVTSFEEGTADVRSTRIEERLDRVDRAVRRLVSAVVFAGLLVAGALVRPGDDVLGTVIMIGAVLPLAHVLLGGRRRR